MKDSMQARGVYPPEVRNITRMPSLYITTDEPIERYTFYQHSTVYDENVVVRKKDSDFPEGWCTFLVTTKVIYQALFLIVADLSVNKAT